MGVWLSEGSAEEDDEDTEDEEHGEAELHKAEILDCSPQPCLLRITTHDPFEASMVRKQSSMRSIRRMTTHDHFESPVNSAHPSLNQLEVRGTPELSALRRLPSFRSVKTYAECLTGPTDAPAQFTGGAESALGGMTLAHVSDEQLHVASAGWAPCIPQT